MESWLRFNKLFFLGGFNFSLLFCTPPSSHHPLSSVGIEPCRVKWDKLDLFFSQKEYREIDVSVKS